MARFIERIKNFLSKCVCRPKKKPAQPTGGEETKPQQEQPAVEEKSEE